MRGGMVVLTLVSIEFQMWDLLKSRSKQGRSFSRTAQNVLAAATAGVAYRAVSWTIDIKLPTDLAANPGGKRGGNPYVSRLLI